MTSSDDGSTDVFVSYSHRDKAFTRRLAAALTSREKTVWVDWEGIPPTAKWRREIHDAIEASDAFLFVISRASLASEVCREELGSAEQLGKRIVPIELGAVDSEALPPVLADHQWVKFRGSSSFEQSVDVLVETLDTDLAWVKEHTRWLQKARGWQRSGRDRSFLLRGSELRAAESWLTTPGAAQNDPAPTPLQNEYVLRSRQAASRRLGGVAAAAMLALAAMTVLAVVAVAQERRATAERETAVSELLASVSRERLNERLDSALLLAVAAYDVKKTSAARDAVLTGVQLTEGVRRIARLSLLLQGPGSVSISSNGRYLANARPNGIVLHDLTRGSRKTLAVPKAERLSLDRDGSHLAAVTSGGVRVYAISRGRIVRPGAVVPKATNPSSLAFAPNEPLLAIGESDGRLVVYDVRAGQSRVLTAPPPPPEAHGQDPLAPVVFDPSGTAVAAVSPFGPYVFELKRGGRVRSPPLGDGDTLKSVALADATSVVAIRGGRLLERDVLTGDETCPPRFKGLAAVAVLAGQIVVGGDDGSLRVIGAACDASPRLLRGHRSKVNWLAAGPHGEIVSVDSDGLAVVWGTRATSLLHRQATSMPAPADVVHGRGGELIVADESLVPDDDASGAFLMTQRGPLRRLAGATHGIAKLAAARDDAVIAASGVPAVWVGRSHRRLRLVGGPRTGLSAALAPDGKLLALGSPQGGIELWDVRTRRRLKRLRTGAQPTATPVTALAIGRSGSIAAGDNTGSVVVWDDSDSKPEILRRRSVGDPVEAISFAPKDDQLLVSASGKEIVLWDVAQPERSTSLFSQTDTKDLAFTPGGDQLVSGDDSGMLRVWDVHARRALGRGFRLGSEPIAGLDIDPSTGALAVLTRGGSLFRADLALWNVEAAIRRICAVAPRTLTDEEWRAAAPGFPRPRVCSSGSTRDR